MESAIISFLLECGVGTAWILLCTYMWVFDIGSSTSLERLKEIRRACDIERTVSSRAGLLSLQATECNRTSNIQSSNSPPKIYQLPTTACRSEKLRKKQCIRVSKTGTSASERCRCTGDRVHGIPGVWVSGCYSSIVEWCICARLLGWDGSRGVEDLVHISMGLKVDRVVMMIAIALIIVYTWEIATVHTSSMYSGSIRQ